MRRLLATAARLGRGGLRRLHPDHATAARAFDRGFYLTANPDVAAAGSRPSRQPNVIKCSSGSRPAADFSVRLYLEAFPEVAASGVNPFVHYLTSGRPRVLPSESPLGFRHEVIAGLIAVEDRIRGATAGKDRLSTETELAAGLAQSRDGLARLHVTFSHDDFTANVGGLQLAVQREAARLSDQGRDHLHLYPAKPWPVVRTAGDPGALGVVLNGRSLGLYSPEAVVRALGKASKGPASARSFAIHSLLGHEAEETADILAAAGLHEGVFWLHDFASLCAGFHLLRNDVEDCAAPPADSAACGICLYGPWRARHVEAHARLFDRLLLTVAAPSRTTLDLWTRSATFPVAGTAILPHATLTPAGPAPIPRAGGPFRLAFAGLPVTHKGWPIFRALAARFANDPRYAFLHLGMRPDPALPIPFRQVSGGPAEPLAMHAALKAEQPDAVLVWPLCRETFSFVAHEAVAAGCAVVTGPDSGNVQAFVAESGHGRVLPDEAALIDAFESGRILELARARRAPMLYDLAFSALTLDLTTGPKA